MSATDHHAHRRITERLAAAGVTTSTRYMVQQVHDSEVSDWYEIGWSYVEPAEVPGFSIIKWESAKPPVAPFRMKEGDQQ